MNFRFLKIQDELCFDLLFPYAERLGIQYSAYEENNAEHFLMEALVTKQRVIKINLRI